MRTTGNKEEIALWRIIKADGSQTLRLTFEEVKSVLGFSIDHSFLTYKKEAAAYGYQVGKISMKEQTVIFSKLD
jgi:hypothetical protein